MKTNQKKRGIVTLIILIIVALLALSYYGFNLRQTVDNPTTQSNFSYVWGAVTYVWDHYLKAPIEYLYHTFVNLIWNPSINDIQNINANRVPNALHNIPSNYPVPPAVH